MSKHRRPSRLSRVRASNSPIHLSVAAGVAGTVAVTGTVVASAADSTTVETTAAAQSATKLGGDVGSPDLNAALADVAFPREKVGHGLRQAVDAEQVHRVEQLARAKARAEAKRKAEKRAAARRRAAQKQASQSRSFSSTASRGVERMSASAANVLQIAAQAASGAYYTHGGAGPTGFDCSGFTSYVFDKVGISLPHQSSAQRAAVQSVSTPQPGDLVFVYNGGGGSIGHVGIYAGGGYWWEAANPSTGVGKHRAWSSAVSYGRVL